MSNIAKFDMSVLEIYPLLRNTSLDSKSALFELVDNAYSASRDNESNITIRVIGDWHDKNGLDLKTARLEVEDEGIGIDPADFANVLIPGRSSKNSNGSLNQFRVGLKNALMTLGCTLTKSSIYDFALISKTAENIDTYQINRILAQGSPIEKIQRNWKAGHGTVVCVESIKDLPKRKEDYTALKYALGVRYQKLIDNDPIMHKKMNLKLILEKKDGEVLTDTNGAKCSYDIKAIKPIYSMSNAPFRKRLVSGSGSSWAATAICNYRPSNEELLSFESDDAKDQINAKHPYYYKRKGVDVFYNGIVIQQISLADLTGVLESTIDRTGRAQYLHLSIILESGFELFNTKNGVKNTPHFEELKISIIDWMKNNGFKSVKNDTPFSEKEIQQRLYNIFVEEHGEDKVNKELTVNHGQRPDFKVNNTLIEIKRDAAETKDIMQLVNYCILTGNTDAKLYAAGFSDNAKNCANTYLNDLLSAAKKWDANKEISIKIVDWRKYM